MACQAAGESQHIVVTEISRDPGATPGHKTHQDGMDVDFRPMTTNGQPGTWRSHNYDQAGTQRLVNTILNVNPGAKILFNDPAIVGVRPFPMHDHHLHVNFK